MRVLWILSVDPSRSADGQLTYSRSLIRALARRGRRRDRRPSRLAIARRGRRSVDRPVDRGAPAGAREPQPARRASCRRCRRWRSPRDRREFRRTLREQLRAAVGRGRRRPRAVGLGDGDCWPPRLDPVDRAGAVEPEQRERTVRERVAVGNVDESRGSCRAWSSTRARSPHSRSESCNALGSRHDDHRRRRGRFHRGPARPRHRGAGAGLRRRARRGARDHRRPSRAGQSSPAAWSGASSSSICSRSYAWPTRASRPRARRSS